MKGGGGDLEAAVLLSSSVFFLFSIFDQEHITDNNYIIANKGVEFKLQLAPGVRKDMLDHDDRIMYRRKKLFTFILRLVWFSLNGTCDI